LTAEFERNQTFWVTKAKRKMRNMASEWKCC